MPDADAGSEGSTRKGAHPLAGCVEVETGTGGNETKVIPEDGVCEESVRVARDTRLDLLESGRTAPGMDLGVRCDGRFVLSEGGTEKRGRNCGRGLRVDNVHLGSRWRHSAEDAACFVVGSMTGPLGKSGRSLPHLPILATSSLFRRPPPRQRRPQQASARPPAPSQPAAMHQLARVSVAHPCSPIFLPNSSFAPQIPSGSSCVLQPARAFAFQAHPTSPPPLPQPSKNCFHNPNPTIPPEPFVGRGLAAIASLPSHLPQPSPSLLSYIQRPPSVGRDVGHP